MDRQPGRPSPSAHLAKLFRSQITVQSGGLAGVTAKIEELARQAVQAAAEEAARAAQAAASIPLELELIAPRGDPDGFAAGIRSRKKGRSSSVEIAHFFDAGTLGGRKTPPKRPRRTSWQVKRGGTTYTATRQSVDGKGIPAERFFLKARVAGRRALVSVIKHGI